MHHRIRLGFSFAVLGLALTAPSPAGADEPEPTSSATIVVDVARFRNTTGALGCRLFRSGAGFPESSAGTVEARVAIAGASARCTFSNVAPGTYAVSVMHDENGNQRLDKNFLGIPIEGYGVSNNRTHALSAPKWEESKFVVEKGKTVSLAIQLRY